MLAITVTLSVLACSTEVDSVNPEPSTTTSASTTTPTTTTPTTDTGETRGQPDGEGGGKGRPADKYACMIDSAGYCIFTGTPHRSGLDPGTDNIIDRSGEFLFLADEAVAVNSTGVVLVARGTPAFDDDDLSELSQDGLTDDEKAFHRVMAIMFPIRNALMYDVAEVTQNRWDQLVGELELREIKETTFTSGPQMWSRASRG